MSDKVVRSQSTGAVNSEKRYESAAFWDRWYAQNQTDASVEWTGHINDEVLKKFLEVIDALPKPEGEGKLRICELGCGSSNLAPLLRDHGADVVGVDFSEEVIKANRERIPDIQWECWDALQLTDKFEEAEFDCIIGKTLIDCFMARSDASGSIRKLFEQCRRVLKPHGAVMLLDKASAENIIGRGTAESVRVSPHKCMTFRVLQAAQKSPDEVEDSEPKQKQWEIEVLPDLSKHFVIRQAAAGSGTLVVWSTDEVANSAGIETGDLIVGYRKNGGAIQAGDPNASAKAIRAGGKLQLLLERPAAGTTQRKTAPLQLRLSSRRSTSQSDHLRRCQKARLMRAADTMMHWGVKKNSLPRLKLKPDSFISEHTCAAVGYFQ